MVVRTPYNKDGPTAGVDVFNTLRAVQAGYVVVAQNVRGRYASAGRFNPHIQETDDGLDAFARAAEQPWSNGRVVTYGFSYLGGTQWLPARNRTPALSAMATSVTFSGGYKGCSYQGGAKVLYDLYWVAANIVSAERERRIRLEASSSNFPRFERNSNTGGDIVNETADQYQMAANRVHHDAAHPSHLISPVIER